MPTVPEKVRQQMTEDIDHAGCLAGAGTEQEEGSFRRNCLHSSEGQHTRRVWLLARAREDSGPHRCQLGWVMAKD